MSRSYYFLLNQLHWLSVSQNIIIRYLACGPVCKMVLGRISHCNLVNGSLDMKNHRGTVGGVRRSSRQCRECQRSCLEVTIWLDPHTMPVLWQSSSYSSTRSVPSLVSSTLKPLT